MGWREMSQDAFIELVVTRGLDTRENLMLSLRTQEKQSAEFDEMKFRKRFIPQLAAMEKADERKREQEERQQRVQREREERRQRVQDTVAAEARAIVSELGMEAAVTSLQAKIRDVSTSCAEKVAQCTAIKDDCQRDLDAALPALEGAVRALEILDKRDIQEIKS